MYQLIGLFVAVAMLMLAGWRAVASLDAKIEGLKKELKVEIDKLDKKIDDRYDKLDKKFDDKFDQLDKKIVAQGREISELKGKVDTVIELVPHPTASI